MKSDRVFFSFYSFYVNINSVETDKAAKGVFVFFLVKDEINSEKSNARARVLVI